MDTDVKDNTIIYNFWHYFLLTTREVFEEVHLGFLVNSHTHDLTLVKVLDICSKSWEKNDYIMANLMKAFMVSQDQPIIPQLIQEILNFNPWVLGCLKNGPKTLIVHIDMHPFIFFMESFHGWSMM
jgi:hypothetical protein